MTEETPDLKVAAISLDISYIERDANIARALGVIETLADDTDIIVLPELFSTSFLGRPELLEKYAEPNDGPSMTAMREVAVRRKCLVSGSFAASEEGRFYNRGFMIMPDGETQFYDKRHLFSVSTEAEIYTGGRKEMPVVSYKGWNISMMICYDLRFPVWSRNINQRYDMLLVPANWPLSRGYAWTHLLIARAIENQAYVVGANRGGRDDYGEYDNMSQIFDGTGHPVGREINGGSIVEATASSSELIASRRRLPAHFDADDFCIPL